MFRLLVVALAVVGLFSLMSGALGTAAAGIGLVVLLPIILLKLFFILMIFGFIGRRMRQRDGGTSHRRGWHRQSGEPKPSDDRFEDWHRIAHAKDEVDSWVEGMPDTRQE